MAVRHPPQAALPCCSFDLHSVESFIHPLPCSSDLPPPERILCTSHWCHRTLQAGKGSCLKLLGNKQSAFSSFSTSSTTKPSPDIPPGCRLLPLGALPRSCPEVSLPSASMRSQHHLPGTPGAKTTPASALPPHPSTTIASQQSTAKPGSHLPVPLPGGRSEKPCIYQDILKSFSPQARAVQNLGAQHIL